MKQKYEALQLTQSQNEELLNEKLTLGYRSKAAVLESALLYILFQLPLDAVVRFDSPSSVQRQCQHSENGQLYEADFLQACFFLLSPVQLSPKQASYPPTH